MNLPLTAPEPSSTERKDKIYLVTHADLSNGYQVAQTAHAIADFIMANPEIAQQWHTISNSIIVLEAKSAESLYQLNLDAKKAGLGTTVFREPDLGDEVTAIAFQPGEGTRKFLSNLPLAGRKLHNQGVLHEREHQLRTMSFAMMDTQITGVQNLLQNGRKVREYYFTLIDHLEGKVDLNKANNWVIPEWLDKYRKEILEQLPSAYIMDRYMTLRMSGGPGVRSEKLRPSFPNYVEASAETYAKAYGKEAKEEVLQLISNDLDAHMVEEADFDKFASQRFAVATLIASLAKITANSDLSHNSMVTSNFKYVYKQINSLGEHVCKQLFAKEGN